MKQTEGLTPYRQQLQKQKAWTEERYGERKMAPPTYRLPDGGIKIQIQFWKAVELGAGIGCGFIIINLVVFICLMLIGIATGMSFTSVLAPFYP
ncbi:MAG: hypothetical protein OXG39_14470 [Chloroflexi bacterium]|nr:hypothetical protein [Chloroflexota bacterium]